MSGGDCLPEQADSFGLLVQRERLARGWTQHDLAKRTGIGQQYLSAIERGNRPDPRLTTLRRLARALGVDGSLFFKEG